LLSPLLVQTKERYCICNRTEAEAPDTMMIDCDICKNWFHGECVNLTPEEMEELEFYACPKCTGKSGKGEKRKFQPA